MSQSGASDKIVRNVEDQFAVLSEPNEASDARDTTMDNPNTPCQGSQYNEAIV